MCGRARRRVVSCGFSTFRTQRGSLGQLMGAHEPHHPTSEPTAEPMDGGWGDDTLAASGGYNYVVGQGGVDTCFNGGEGGCTCEIKDCGDEDETSEPAAVAP